MSTVLLNDEVFVSLKSQQRTARIILTDDFCKTFQSPSIFDERRFQNQACIEENGSFTELKIR